MADFLDEKRQEIADRLSQLEPLVQEYQHLESVASALNNLGRPRAAAPQRRHRRGRPPGAKNKPKAARRTSTLGRGSRKGSGQRSAQALALVQTQPGITIPELARKMGINQNYLYRVMPALLKERKVSKEGRGWHPRAK